MELTSQPPKKDKHVPIRLSHVHRYLPIAKYIKKVALPQLFPIKDSLHKVGRFHQELGRLFTNLLLRLFLEIAPSPLVQVMTETKRAMTGQIPAPGRPLVVEISLKTAEGDSLVLEWWRLAVVAGGDPMVSRCLPVSLVCSEQGYGSRLFGRTWNRIWAMFTGSRIQSVLWL